MRTLLLQSARALLPSFKSGCVNEKMSQFSKDIADYRENVVQIRHYIETGGYLDGTDESSKRNIRKNKDKYMLKDGVLFYYTRSKILVQVLTTEDEILNVLSQCHSNMVGGGHTGILTTREKVGSRYFWKKWCKHVQEYVSTCQACQKFEKVKTQAPQLQQIKVSEPLELVGIDLIGPLSLTSSGNRYILTMTDYFTKFVDLFALPDKTARAVSRSIKTFVTRWGCPKRILTDQGKEFCNQINMELCHRLQIKKSVTSAYHPQTNGLDEHTNQTVKMRLGKLMADHGSDWDEMLDDIAFSIRTQRQSSTKFSPFFLMFGRQPRLPIEMVDASEDPLTFDFEDADTYASHLAMKQQDAHTKALDNQDKAHAKQKVTFELRKSKGVKTFDLTVGQLVYRRNMANAGRKGGKTQPGWTGPYRILDILDNQTVSIAAVKPGCKNVALARNIPYDQLKPMKLSMHDATKLAAQDCTSSVAQVINVDMTLTDPLSFLAEVSLGLQPNTGDPEMLPGAEFSTYAHSPQILASNPLIVLEHQACSDRPGDQTESVCDKVLQQNQKHVDRDVILTGFSGPTRRCAEVIAVQRCVQLPQEINIMKQVFLQRTSLFDSHIDHFSALLAHQFPSVDGLQRCAIFEADNHARVGTPADKFVQILLVGAHWVTVSNIQCNAPGQVKVYDSVYKNIPGDHRPKFVEQVAWMLFSPMPELTMLWPDVQHQKGGHACGLFALSNAFALCAGIMPEECVWDQGKLWNHFMTALETGVLNLPPRRFEKRRHRSIVNTERERLYCICRQPALRQRFLLECRICKESYHQECEDVPHVGDDTVFLCRRCK